MTGDAMTSFESEPELRDSEGARSADVIVIGAGLAGLLAAQRLRDRGISVRILEAEEDPGGRLATRGIGGGLADSGAQFFTVRSASFGNEVHGWVARGLAREWSRGWTDASLEPAPREGHIRYAATGGMGALAASLAGQLPVETGTRVTRVETDRTRWVVEAESGERFRSRGLLLTPPAPLTLRLLEESGVALSLTDRSALAAIRFAPCLAGLFAFRGDVRVPAPGGIQSPDALTSWIADNRGKGISADVPVLTVHTRPETSRELWDEPDDAVLGAMRRSIAPYLGNGAEEIGVRLDRWRHSLPVTLHSKRRLVLDGLPPAAIAGDAFGEPRMEGAALSGLSAAQALESLLGRGA